MTLPSPKSSLPLKEEDPVPPRKLTARITEHHVQDGGMIGLTPDLLPGGAAERSATLLNARSNSFGSPLASPCFRAANDR
jgi:hypothetical protein